MKGRPRTSESRQDLTERRRAEAELKLANRRAQALSARLLQAQETERRHIARELHDEIGQALTAIQFSLQRMRRKADANALVSDIDECWCIASRALDEVRSMSLNLRPAHLDDLGLEAAIAWLLGQQCDAAGLRRSVVAAGVPRVLPPEVEIACFRVTQEALTNVVRHAEATEVTVELRCECGTLSVSIADNGRGFDVAAAQARSIAGQSLGLLGMDERTALAGGRLSIKPRAEGGTCVSAYFPLGATRPRDGGER